MAILAPFRGVHFNPDKVNRLEDVVTPPYDVISEEEGTKFLQKNAYNMIQLDLRNSSQDNEGDADRYQRAKDLFQTWQEQGVLVRDEQPAIYLYAITYIHPSGRRLTRKGLIALVGLADFSEGIVKPHEETFDRVIVDRLQLMDACRAQFSKVFSLYRDPRNEVIATLEEFREPEPLCSLKDHLGNTHTLWRVTDTGAIERVCRYFADQPVYIADGHHRYTTALACRETERQRNPSLPADSPYNFIMMYLSATGDEGMSVLPTHRLFRHPASLAADDCIRLLQEAFDVEEINGGSREILVAEVLARMNEWQMSSDLPVFGLYHAGEDRSFLMVLRGRREDYTVLADLPDELRQLDVAVLSELVIRHLLGVERRRIVDDKLMRYFSDPDDAIDVAVKQSIDDGDNTPLLFLVNPTRVEEVTAVADSGRIMPHKSTYFYPKILTGLMINKLEADERIRLPAGKGSTARPGTDR